VVIVLAGVPSWALAGGLACAIAPRRQCCGAGKPRRTAAAHARRAAYYLHGLQQKRREAIAAE
jgi:hypothetical protein